MRDLENDKRAVVNEWPQLVDEVRDVVHGRRAVADEVDVLASERTDIEA